MCDLPKLSRAVSRALRHEPWLYELELDGEGWTSVDDLLQALRGESPEWVNLEVTDLENMLLSSPKRRHELSGGRIRALYGHSVPTRIVKPQEGPPQKLFHGTSRESLEAIQSEGLRPMRRQYVHLSEDVEMAKQVGQRKDTDPILLRIDSAAAHGDNVKFYRGGEKVWLADGVPAAFISVVPQDE
ncbi:RNA 2'-phosphotransferase [Paenarthrobacter nicotinovorans]|uniref:RNA 2'-phosphotransferase n=1 Tax=Paenarthrobacter nicotinovorans TaxID=29320 RepID=UPI0011A1BB4E|nr:RNA 2'-phosphotransferase [Paenarthrobacter nicotinovorans]